MISKSLLTKHSLLKIGAFIIYGQFQIDLFTHAAAILDSIVSDIYYGMLRGQIHTNLPPSASHNNYLKQQNLKWPLYR